MASDQFPVLLLTGPRQVGKTTMLRHLCESQRRYISLDDLAVRDLAKRDPQLFLQRFPPPLLIDEIQYAPGLLVAIKQEVDRQRVPGAFWLTGSQQFSVMKGITETLAGRVGIINLLGFSAREMSDQPADRPPFLPRPDRMQDRAIAAHDVHGIYRGIWEGSFPSIITGEIRDRGLFYRSYIQTYLERDVRDLTQVGDLDAFGRFLKSSAARTGQMLNYSDMARDCGISVNTARAWMSILVASFQVFLLPSYHTNLSKRLYRTPKLYFLDTGLATYLTEWSSPETLEAGAMAGAIFETHVFVEILKSWWYSGEETGFFYYRDKDNHEVDLLISYDGKLWPVEIKKAIRVDGSVLSNLDAPRRLGLPVGRGAVVCLAPSLMPLSADVDVVPVSCI